jgi:hypothetical protein
LLFIDYYSRKQFDKSILCLHDDKGGEFIGIKWDACFAQHGIRRKHTVKALPQQNGVAERLNCTLEELLVAMLNGARLPAWFWGEGLNYLRHIIVRSLSSSIPTGTTPYEMVHKRKPGYSPLRAFGCRAWAHIQRKERKSLQDPAKPCVFLGCPDDFKGWKLWDPSANGGRGGIIVSRDIMWNKEEFPGLSRIAHDAIPERFGRSAEPGDAEHSPDEEEDSDSTDLEGVAILPPFESAVPPSDSDSSSSSSRSSSTASPSPSPPRTPPRPAPAPGPPRTPPHTGGKVLSSSAPLDRRYVVCHVLCPVRVTCHTSTTGCHFFAHCPLCKARFFGNRPDITTICADRYFSPHLLSVWVYTYNQNRGCHEVLGSSRCQSSSRRTRTARAARVRKARLH